MATIVPRWEWRTFGSRFGLAEARFGALTPDAEQESDELYLLGGSGGIAKVRHDLMDIKLRREVDTDGLERWEPVMKQGFPLPAEAAAHMYAALSLAAPPLGRATYTFDQFLDELVRPGGVLRPVKVHKHRTRYTVGGCVSEVSEVWADDKAGRTIAIESEDAAAVVAAVKSTGLAGYFNTNYPVGLRWLLDDAPERFAAIDVGTNSVKLHVAERDRGGPWRAIADRAELTRLGEGLDSAGEIGTAAADRTADAIAEMVAEAKGAGVRAIVAVGTAGLRIARNGTAVAEAIRTRTGLPIEVLSGEEESRLAYLAVVAALDKQPGSLAVFDTGGGSTQFTFGQDAVVEERFSINLGAVRYTERFGLDGGVTSEVLKGALAAIAADLSQIDGRPRPKTLVGLGGAVTNMAAVKHALPRYDPDLIQGTVLDSTEIDRQIETYRSRDASGRRGIVGLQPKRAEVILAGACVVRTVMDKLGSDHLVVSDRGLRHGVLAERFG